MRHSSFVLVLAGLTILLAGCAAYGYDGARHPDRRGPYRYPDTHRVPDYRTTRLYRQVDRDVGHYVAYLDRELRLDRRQARAISRLLHERTYTLLDRTHPSHHRRVYPFPRRFDRHEPRTVRRWWHHVDRDVERYLDRWQRREYRWLTDDDRRRYDRRDRYDRRYDDEYEEYRERSERREGRYREGDHRERNNDRRRDDRDDG